MKFYPNEIDDAYLAEKVVWQKLKIAFKDDPGVAFHRYHISNKNGTVREIDILMVHPHIGLWILECKGCYIRNIKSINGVEWRMHNWYEDTMKPLIQAQDQMFGIKKRLKKELNFSNLLFFNFKVALPFINYEEWEKSTFYKLINIQNTVLIADDLVPIVFKNKLIQQIGNRQQKLTKEQWRMLIDILCGTNQTLFDKPVESTSKTICTSTEEPHKQENEKSLIINTVSQSVQTSSNDIYDKQLEQKSCSSEVNAQTAANTIKPEINISLQGEFNYHQQDVYYINLDAIDYYERFNHYLNSDKSRRRKQTQKKHYTEDSIRLYLQEIGRIRLLCADEEIELARKIAELLELERARERLCERLERDPRDSEWAAEVALPLPAFRYRLHVGRRAKDKMVLCNLRLVVSIAKKYMNRGLSFQDLIQEGSLGLIRATEKFDHQKGYKFSTYATWWIRQAITRAIADQSRTIRLPVHLYEVILHIKNTTKLLSKEMRRKPTGEEIATRMGMTIYQLRFIAKSAQLPISLETPIGKEEDYGLVDFIESDRETPLVDFIESDRETPEDQLLRSSLREDLEKVLDSLSPRERDVLRLRYGLDDGRMKTLEEIGQIFNVPRERIRQIEAKALRKLRHPSRNGILKEYICKNHIDYSQHNTYHEQLKTNHNSTDKIDNASSYPQEELISHKLKRFMTEINKFIEAIKLDKNNAETYYQKGINNVERHFHKEAIEDFTQAINIDSKYIAAYYQRGHCYYSLGYTQKALDDYSQVLLLNPDDALAYFYRGYALSKLGKMQQAISNYNQSLKINPNFADAYLYRGIVFFQLEDLHKAFDNYNHALYIDPNFAEAYTRRGLLYYRLGKFQQAIEDYSLSLTINSENELVYYYRGIVYEKLNEYMKATQDYNKALQINPSFTDVYYKRGSIFYLVGSYQRALEDLDKLIYINPNDAQAYNKRSSIRSAIKDYQGAIEDLQKASELNNI